MSENIELSADEKILWDRNKHLYAASGIPIPYLTPFGSYTIAGTFYLMDQHKDSYTVGSVVGAINGSYHLDKNSPSTRFGDPTGTFQVRIKLELKNERLMATHCIKSTSPDHEIVPKNLYFWKCSPSVTIVSW